MKLVGARRRAAVLVVLGAAACGSPFDADGPGWLQASVIAPDTTTRYEGTGTFSFGHPPPSWGVDIVFNLHSSGVGESGGDEVFFRRHGGGRPGRGHYPIVPDYEMPYSPGFVAMFTRNLEGGGYEAFRAHSGEVRIDGSSEKRVAGTFRIEAYVWCLFGTDASFPSWQCEPWRRWPGLPARPDVELEGSFSVVLDDAPDVPLVGPAVR